MRGDRVSGRMFGLRSGEVRPRRPFEAKALAGVAALLLTVGLTSPAASADESSHGSQRPNIVFLLADDLGWTDINPYSPHEDDYYETPHISQLAGEGIRFTSAYTNGANCAPTRASLMSGQYYPNQPVYTVGSGARGRAEHRKLRPADNETVLPQEKFTLAEALQEAGYRTAFLGKWHLGNPPEAGPRQQGFDVNIGGYGTGHPNWEGQYFRPNNNPYIDDARNGEYLTDYLTRKAITLIEDAAESAEPFYLQFSYYTVHTPLQAPERLVEKYEQKEAVNGHDDPRYAAMIESLDTSVGRILRALDRLDVSDNTLVIFYSDNGGHGGYRSVGLENNGISDNTPLKGGKGTFYEGGIRVPLIIRWPDVIEPGRTVREPVVSIDFYPTLLDAAGVEPLRDNLLDGISFLPVLADPEAELERRPLYWHFPGYLQAYGPGNWRTSPVSVLRAGPWKLLKFYEGDRLELYHLENDPGEHENLAAARTETRRRLHERLEDWLERTETPIPAPSDRNGK